MSQQLIYLAMAGLDAAMGQTAATANNLSNRSTTAFKAQQAVYEAEPLYGQGLPDRVATVAREDGADFRPGPIQQTGRKLDVAVKGGGWIAVLAADGTIGLTRNGALTVSQTGLLETNDGHPVLGQGGNPISLPPLQRMTIGSDGTISGTLTGQNPNQVLALNRIFLVDPPTTTLERRSDGLFQASGGTPQPDAKIRLQVGALEGSNVDTVSLMMNMIETSRLFQMQTDLMRKVLGLAQGQGSVLSLS
jgi:flagellar basal-body rod protein FlgF